MSDFSVDEAVTNDVTLVTPGVLKEVVSFLSSKQVIDDMAVAELRNDYPDLRFTLCFEEEMGSRDAFVEHATFDLHLVAHSTNGCSSLTYELKQSSGFVIALHDEDE